MSLRDALREIFDGRAKARYGLAHVNQLQHALQAAAIAEADGEPAGLITAALLHDIGHMLHAPGAAPEPFETDDQHEVAGALWLAGRFGPEVSEPVRLHVAAKRYLVATEPGYGGILSPDSVRTLALQGGPMSPEECAAFERLPEAVAAVRLRRIDEKAKDPHRATEGFDYFLRYVEACASGAPAPAPAPASVGI